MLPEEDLTVVQRKRIVVFTGVCSGSVMIDMLSDYTWIFSISCCEVQDT